MTDEKAFKLGKNVATTPGKVVFQTELMQLIQFQPTTQEVYKTPLVIIPPWINKYYILDLRAVELLHQVGARPGPHGVRAVLGESGCAPRADGLRGLHEAGAARGARRRGEGDRRAAR